MRSLGVRVPTETGGHEGRCKWVQFPSVLTNRKGLEMERDCFYNELKYVRDYACKAAGLDSEIAGWKTAVDAMTKQLADAQATVEALQRERDEWRSNAVAQEARANDLERDCKDLLSDIDGERAKVGDLLKKIAYWEKRHSTYRELAEENMNLKSAELSAHQGLVRALQRERDKLREATKVICGHCCEPMEIPSKAVLQSQLTQRTAELEALQRERDTARR